MSLTSVFIRPKREAKAAWWIGAIVVAFITHWSSASAAELSINSSALEKLLKTQIFRDGGKYRLAPKQKCNDPYLEYPAVEIHGGRIYVHARFAGRIGGELAGVCVSVGEPSAILISGRPQAAGEVLSFDDVRVESIEKPTVRKAAQGLIESALRSALKINIREQLAPNLAPTNTAPYFIELTKLTFVVISADAERLRLGVDFSASAR